MKIVLFANTDWFLFNFKLSLAKALRARGDDVLLLSPPGEYGPRLCELGFRWEPISVSRSGVNPLSELRVVQRLTTLYRNELPDVVHHFTIKCVIYGSIAARRAGVCAIVNSITGLGFTLLANSWKARIIRPVVLALYRFSLADTHVVFQNRDNQETLSKYGVLGQCHDHVIPGDGIDVTRFAPSTPTESYSAGASSGPSSEASHPFLIVLMMARLLHSKGISEFVMAARHVRAALPSTRFLLAGAPDPGNPESIHPDLLDVWREAGDVEFLGHSSDAVALNQAADIVVLASTQGEGIPRALLEGAACGSPMVATDVPGNRDVVVPGVTGILVPPGDAIALANAIIGLLRDDASRRRMGALARAAVEKDFSDARIIGQTLAVYENALATH